MTNDLRHLSRGPEGQRTRTRNTVVVTGATGFVGTALIASLVAREGIRVRAVVREESVLPRPLEWAAVGDIHESTNWDDALANVDVVVHLAARVHVMREQAADPLAEFRRTNVAGSLYLAECAAAAGVRRFLYLSSIKVNGETGIFRETDRPAPADPYGISKAEAEEGLRSIAARTGMELVVIRPPLVYGPGVKGNFRRLIVAVKRGIPLPLGAVHNERSLIALGNLVDFIITCMVHPQAANQTFLVSDGEDLSTTNLVQRLARAMGRSARLFPVPVAMLSMGAAIFGRRAVARRLLGSLQVDISKARQLLGWAPPLDVEAGLQRAVEAISRPLINERAV